MSTTLRPHARLAGAAVVIAALLALASACGHSPSAPTGPCSFTLSASSQSFTADGGRGSVSVATRSDCAWSVAGAGEWLALASGASVTGPGAIDYTVAANTAGAREKAITIAGLAFTVRQDAAAACAYALDPERRDFEARGGAGSVAVATAASCAWTAESTASWIAIPGGRVTGTGPGTVSYTVAANGTPTARTETIRIAGRTHTVEQRGEASTLCEYHVSPVQFDPCMPAGTGSASVTTAAGCRWTASSSRSWLKITRGASGTGPGTIGLAWTDNYLAPRQGMVMVRWTAPTLGQNIRVDQAGCTFAVSRSALDVGSAGGAVSVDVMQMSDPYTCGGPLQDGCVWSAKSDVSWIVVSTRMPASGDGRLTLTVSANSGAARTGHVTIANKTVTVTQSSGA